MKYIKLRRSKSKIYFYFNKVKLGYAYREVDGYYVFQFEQLQGYWSDYILREIADILTDLNEEWNKQVITDLK